MDNDTSTGSPASALSAVSNCSGRPSSSLSTDEDNTDHCKETFTQYDINFNSNNAAFISRLTRKCKMLLSFLNKNPTHFSRGVDETSDDSVEIYSQLKARTLKAIILFSMAWWLKKMMENKKLKAYALLRKLLSQRKFRLNKMSDLRYANELPISLLLSAAKDGFVQKALVNDRLVVYKLASSTSWKKSSLPKNISSEVITTLSDGGCADISVLPESLLSRAISIFVPASPFLYLALLYQMMKRLQKDRDGIDYTSTDDFKTNTKTTFADVAGVDPAKEELKEIISYLSDPLPFISLGASPPNGVLLFGPPGNGKTLLARAVAGEAKADYFLSCSGSDFIEIYVGQGAKRVRDVFTQTRKEALKRWHKKIKSEQVWNFGNFNFPTIQRGYSNGQSNQGMRPPTAVLFIDEIDSLAKCRDGIGRGISYDAAGGNDEREQTLNALLTEMDGFNKAQGIRELEGRSPKVTLIVIAATNRISVIDPAILRPGRFDRHVHVHPPDEKGRREILKIHAKRVKMGIDVNISSLAKDEFTANFTGAELKNVINEAALLAVRRSSKVVCHGNLLCALQRIRQMKEFTR